jgi:hypothetical protein
MQPRISALLTTFTLLFVMSVMFVMGLCVPGAGPTTARADDATTTDPATPTKDIVVLRSGTVVEGRILEETATRVKMLVMFAGIEAPTTYRMSEILEIQRDIPVVTDLPGAINPAESDEAAWGGDADQPADIADSASDKPKVYRFVIEGQIIGAFPAIEYLLESNRRDVISYTPVERTMRDALSYNPDVIIVEMDADAPSGRGWDGGHVTEPLQPIFQELIDDPSVRVVFWIKNAAFGAAFLPFTCPEMYFESEGFLGGIGTLDDFDLGDDLVNEKQISLRIVGQEGVAIKNGYDPAIVRGMARKQNWLSYRFRHGKVEFLEHEPREIDGEGWVLLTDNGKGANKDSMLTRGNDVLNFNAKIAQEIGLSKGTYDDIDDLVFALGIRGEYDLIEGRAERNFTEWRDRVELGLDRYVELVRELENPSNRGANDTPLKKLGVQRRLLREIRGLLTTYEELFDPQGGERAGIDIQLEAMREEIRRASEAERTKAKRPGNRRR